MASKNMLLVRYKGRRHTRLFQRMPFATATLESPACTARKTRLRILERSSHVPYACSSLEWVGILTPDALDSFLVEKLDARRALVELDLEPSGLVIKHDDDGEVERVEPALEKVRCRASVSPELYNCDGASTFLRERRSW